MSTHYCQAVGCDFPVTPTSLMCSRHWAMVPREVQNLIWHYYRKGQEIDKEPTANYIAAAFISISCVAMKEGRPLPTLRSANAEVSQPANESGGEHQKNKTEQVEVNR